MSPSFAEFYEALHGRTAFPWQERLAVALVDGEFPDGITAPTGMGKTSALDAWVWALAMQVESMGTRRTVPTRAAFVVDRRVIVQAAFEHARNISDILQSAPSGPAKWAADALKTIGGGLALPLAVVQMRGGVTWSWRWLERPDQPAIVVGTVDQLGSRFLFRGYGVGDRLRSIDAALVGSDTLAFLDEAHLSTALVRTVRSATAMEFQSARPASLRPLSIVPMSATPPGDELQAGRPMSIDHRDLDHPAAAMRLSARKRAHLIDVEMVSAAKSLTALAAALSGAAVTAATPGKVVAVVANTIDAARAVHDQLKVNPAIDVVLVIGRSRDLDREQARARWWSRAAAGRIDRVRAAGRALVVVATQTIEVGADLDIDSLVTELAPIDSLVQRFGRVDRLGEVGETESWIVRERNRSAGPRNFLYGDAADNTWEWLESIAWSPDDPFDPIVELGSLSMAERLADMTPDRLAVLVAPVPLAPELTRENLHLLARTCPAPDPDMPVSTFLHGMRTEQITVNVVWRAGLFEADGQISASLTTDLPTTAEAVEVPLVHVVKFLRDDHKVRLEISDLDVLALPQKIEDGRVKSGADGFRAVLVTSPTDTKIIERPAQLRPGNLVVLESRFGGHDQFGWTGVSGEVVADIADLVRSGAPQLRLSADSLRSLLGESPTVATALEHLTLGVAADVRGEFPEPPLDDLVAELLQDVAEAAEGRPLVGAIQRLVEELPRKGWTVARRPGRTPCIVLDYPCEVDDGESFGSLRLCAGTTRVRLDDADDSELGSSQMSEPVPLTQHLGAVGDRAEMYAKNLGLDDVLVESLRLAGAAHDLGKADLRFQTILRNGDWLAATASDGVFVDALAKSRKGQRGRRSEVEEKYRWPRGMRHEAVSVALLREAVLPPAIDRELVEHLVAAHHGWSRPLFPTVIDSHPVKVKAEFGGEAIEAQSDSVVIDWDQPGRFRRLCERYGWWGISTLESILRLADISVSEEGS